MGKDKLEHNIKNKLSSYESAVNTDALWAGIQAGIATPAAPTVVATGSSFLKTWGLGMVIAATIGIVAISYYAINSAEKATNDSSMNSSVPATDSDLSSDNSLTKSSNLVSTELTQTKETTSQTEGTALQTEKLTSQEANMLTPNSDSKLEAKMNTQSTSVAQSSSSIIETANIKGTSSTTQSSSQSNVSSKGNTSSRKNASSQGNTSTQQNNNFGSQSIPPSTQNHDSSSNSPVQTKPNAPSTNPLGLTQKEEPTNFAVSTENSTSNSKDVVSSTQNSSLKSNLNKALVSSSTINRSSVENLSYNTGIGLVNAQLPKKPIECPSFGGKSNSGGVFMLELQAIPYYSIPRITALNEAGETWKQTKLDTESYLETFQVNLLARYQMNNGLYFNAGVGYGQLDEKLNFESMQTIVTQEELPVTIIIRPDGINDTIPAQIEVTQDSFFIAETYNYHRMVEFTAAVGYEIPINPKFSIYGDVGLSINILTTRSGYHVLDDIDLVSFDNESRPVYTTSTGYKMTGGLGLRYYAGNGVVLSGGPEFRSHLSNWIRDEHPIELRYLDVGVRAAVGYMF